jgi:hypothetical protein
MIKLALLTSLFALVPGTAWAHCPLCTAGAGVLAVAAGSLGISTAVVGVFVGAFALALGMWMALLITRKYIVGQNALVTIATFLLTVVPVMPLIQEYRPLYVSLAGEYGTILHSTYAINMYVAGALVGAVVLAGVPQLSKTVTHMRGHRQIPYQGVSISLLLLLITGLTVQLVF